MKRAKMAVLTTVAVALLMSWAVPSLMAELKNVNINTASVSELMELDGVGEKVAAKILEFRKKNGSFQKPEDLMMVKGIGQKMFEKNKDRITVK